MKWIVTAVFSLAFAGCSSPRDASPHVGELYRDSAKRYARNPVVVLHGILGARLEQKSTGRTVWGAFAGDFIDPSTPDGARALALPMLGGEEDMQISDVGPTGPLQAIQVGLFFTIINVGVYADILRSLGVGGYTDSVLVDPASPTYNEDHYTCWTFFYDWRKDCIENAIALGDYLTTTRARIERTARDRVEALRAVGGKQELEEAAETEAWLASDWRFDVVAHSMGGLLARYYLRYGANDLPADGSEPEVTWEGSKEIDRLVMVGTPNLGSMESFETLLVGFKPGPFLPHYDASILCTMPSIFQLMPRNGMGLVLDADGDPAEVDIFDPAVWEANDWGMLCESSKPYLEWLMPGLSEAARRQRAVEVLTVNLERARALHAALDKSAPTRSPAEIRLFAADAIRTKARTRLDVVDGKLAPCFDGDELAEFGDGTVPRYSAVADRAIMSRGWIDSPIQWDNVTFLPDDHIGLTKNPLFTDNLLFYLLQQPPRLRQ